MASPHNHDGRHVVRFRPGSSRPAHIADSVLSGSSEGYVWSPRRLPVRGRLRRCTVEALSESTPHPKRRLGGRLSLQYATSAARDWRHECYAVDTATFTVQTRGVQLAPFKPATELEPSIHEGEPMRLPLPCGKHESFYPAAMALETLRAGTNYSSVGYVIRTQTDGRSREEMGQARSGRGCPRGLGWRRILSSLTATASSSSKMRERRSIAGRSSRCPADWTQ